MALRDIDVDINLDIDRIPLDEFNKQINETLRLLGLIDDDNINDLTNEFRKLDKQLDDATRDVKQLNRQVETLSDARVDVDVEEAQADINRLRMQIESLDHDDVNVHIDVRNASRELTKLDAKIKALDAQDINIDVNINGVLTEIAKMKAELAAASMTNIRVPLGGGGIGGIPSIPSFGPPQAQLAMMAVKVVALTALLPALAIGINVLVGGLGSLGVVIGVVAGGLTAFISALAVAGSGVLGFGAVATSTITDLYKENAQLTAGQKELKAQTDIVADSWNNLKESLSSQIFDVVNGGVKVLNSLLTNAEPIFKSAGASLGGLMDSLSKSFNLPDVQAFFGYLSSAIGPLTTSLGQGLGNALRGVGNTIVALGPLTSWMADGFDNMMAKFANWTSGLKDSNGMKTFIDYVKENLPKIGSILGDAAVGVSRFFAAFDTTASGGLDWLEDKMNDFKNWASSLDNNKGFQDFFDNIARNAPEVANIIGNITKNIIGLTNALSNSGVISMLSKFSDFTKNFDLQGIADNFNLSSVFKPNWKVITDMFNWDRIFGGIGDWFKNFNLGEKISGWFSNVNLAGKVNSWFSNIDFGSIISKAISSINVGKILSDTISSVKPNFGGWFTGIGDKIRGTLDSAKKNVSGWFNGLDFSGSISNTFSKLKLPELKIPKIEAPKVDVPKIETPKFSWPSFPKFSWPKLPEFKWPSLPKFHWPSLPKFNWPAYPKFSWPSIPTVNVSVTGAVNGSHANGLGRVPYDGYVAELHNNEAVLTAQQADTLRATGMLQGDGTAPSLDMGAVSNYAPLADTGSTTTNNSSSSQSVTIHAPVTIHVEGGKDSESTAKNVKDQLDEWFADLQDIFPAVLEG